MQSLRGKFIVAAKALADPNFTQSVVLIVSHDERGALGLVLNRTLDLTVKEAWKEFGQADACEVDGPMFLGGPCEGVVMALHSTLPLGQIEVMPGVYFSNERSALESLAADPPEFLRVFVSYSGWSPGQLEGELAERAWLILAASRDLIFGPHERLWKKLQAAVALASAHPGLKCDLLPDDPGVN